MKSLASRVDNKEAGETKKKKGSKRKRGLTRSKDESDDDVEGLVLSDDERGTAPTPDQVEESGIGKSSGPKKRKVIVSDDDE